MEGLIAFLQQWIDNPQILRIVLIALMGGTFVIFGLGLGFLTLSATNPIRRRLGSRCCVDGQPLAQHGW